VVDRAKPPMRKATARTISFLGSLRLAIVLLVLLTLAAVVGGILPQRPTTPNAMEIYRSYGVFWYRLITRLALDDIFHSGWFFALVALFAVNLVLCTTRRVRRSFHRSFHEVLASPRYLALPSDGGDVLQLESLCSRESTIRSVRQALRKIGYRRIDVVHSPNNDTQIIGRRQRWGRLAPDLVHLGILIILIGGLLGALRQEGSFIINEWEKGTRFLPCSSTEGGPCVPDSFAVQVDDFGVETYEDTPRVKDYWAEVSIWTDNRLDRRGRISVNRPLTVRGIGFYAWRYGDDVQGARLRIHVYDRERNVVISETELGVGETVPIPGTQLWLTAIRFFRTFALDEQGTAVDLGNVSGGHSAVLLQVAGNDEARDDVVYRDLALPFVPDVAVAAPTPYVFVLADVWIPSFIEVHFARNPGYSAVWWGFVLLMVGLAGSFYFVPSSVRVSIREEGVTVWLEGRREANPPTGRLLRLKEAILREQQEEER